MGLLNSRLSAIFKVYFILKGGRKIMNNTVAKLTGILIIMVCCIGISSAEESSSKMRGIYTNILDFTEGGHVENDFGANTTAEWWYINGEAEAVSPQSTIQHIGFFMVLAHQESIFFPPINGSQSSHLLTFYALYYDNGTSFFDYTEEYVPQVMLGNYLSLHTPYVYYVYPGGSNRLCGSAYTGYDLQYLFNDTKIDLNFRPIVEKTVDQADQPLNFITYEHSCGIHDGSIFLGEEEYTVTSKMGYMDHMITNSDLAWSMDMHGWNWCEVTAGGYQAIVYAVRGKDDGYDTYSSKHMTLLNMKKGTVIAEYSGNEITITESDWIDVTDLNRSRPQKVVYSTDDLIVTIEAENVAYFNQTVDSSIGFVDFASYQPNDATIEYKNKKIKKGSAFFEYLVSNWHCMDNPSG